MNGDLFDLFEGGNAFQNPLSSSGVSSVVSSTSASITSINGITDTQVKGAITAGGLSSSKLATATNALSTASTGASKLVAYGQQTVSETFSRVSTVNAYTSGLTAIGRAPTTCDTVNDAFRIIQETGAQWLGNIEDSLGVVGDKLAELYALAAQGVSAGLAKIQALAAAVSAEIDKALIAVNKIVQDITDGIAAELAHLEALANKCVNFCMSSELANWMKDSCVAGAINKMASSQLKTMLS